MTLLIRHSPSGLPFNSKIAQQIHVVKHFPFLTRQSLETVGDSCRR